MDGSVWSTLRWGRKPWVYCRHGLWENILEIYTSEKRWHSQVGDETGWGDSRGNEGYVWGKIFITFDKSFYIYIYSFVGLRRKNKPLSWCLDIKQLLCIFGNCGQLYHEWGAMWWAFKQYSYIFSSSFLQKSYLLISKSCWENIQARTWPQSSGQHWRHMASKTKFVNLVFIPLDFVYWPVVRLWLLWWIMQVTTIHWWKH